MFDSYREVLHERIHRVVGVKAHDIVTHLPSSAQDAISEMVITLNSCAHAHWIVRETGLCTAVTGRMNSGVLM